MANGDGPLWDRLARIEERLIRMESRDVMTAREVDKAIQNSRHQERKDITAPKIADLGVQIIELRREVAEVEACWENDMKELRADVGLLRRWQDQMGGKLFILAIIGSMLGTSIVGAIVVFVAERVLK